MIIVIVIFLIMMSFATAMWRQDNRYSNKETNHQTVRPGFTPRNLIKYKKSRTAFFWFALVALGLCSAAWGISYKSYLDSKAFYDATREQYASAIEVYTDHATIDVNSIAWTDLKYQGYQNEVASFIKDLRKKVTEYNETIVKKKVFKKNIFFNWLVVSADPDMVVIKLLEPKGTMTDVRALGGSGG